ncbi:hypothetical protein [Nesterenkonia alba]|uniref:hypothetical protein n=1 Tax=Nesterenkonia alba TaxID=515814 RepID=UPI0012EC17EE|nr:hypothetical protein [Nesterenkonia alba]
MEVTEESTVPDGMESPDTPYPSSEEEYFEQQLQFHRLDEPPEEDVSPERVITPEEYDEVTRECMHDQGWEVEVLEDGGVSASFPDDQRQAFNEASYICAVRYPLHPVFYEEKTEEVLSVYYEYFTGDFLECLNHYSISVDEVPSFQVFLEDYQNSGWLWRPDRGMEDQVLDETSCDRQPPDESLVEAYE